MCMSLYAGKSLKILRFLFIMAVIFAIAWPEHATARNGLIGHEAVSESEFAQQSSPSADAEESLVFTPPLSGVGAFARTRGPASAIAAHLSAATELPMRAYVPTDYGNTLLGLEKGQYDIVYLPAPFFLKAQADYGLTPGVAGVVNGSATETGLVLVRAESEATTLSDLAGLRVGAAKLESGAGWVMPAAALKEAGVNPFSDIDAQFTGSDVDSLNGLLAEELDAVFVSAAVLEDASVLEANPDVATAVKVLAEFADVPVGVVAFSADMSAAQQQALVTALLDPALATATDDAGNPLLVALGLEGFATLEGTDFTALFAAAQTMRMVPTEAELPVTTSILPQGPLVFTPPLSGVGAFARTRGPASALAAHLGGATRLPMRAYVPTDYGNTLLGLERGQYDVLYLPAPFFLKAQADYGVIPGVSGVVNGSATETGLVLVRAESSATTLADLAGLRVGAAKLESGAGWVMPAAALKEAGVNPFSDIDAQFTGTDVDSLNGLLAEELDAVFVSAAVLEDATVLEANPDVATAVKVLAEFADVPVGVVAFSADVSEAQQQALVTALLDPALATATDDADTLLLGALGVEGFATLEGTDFTALLAAAKTLGMIR